MKLTILVLFFSLISLSASANEGRGEHRSQIWCTISELESAKDCMKRLAKAMPTENDDNAVFVAQGEEAKKLMAKIADKLLYSRNNARLFVKKYFL